MPKPEPNGVSNRVSKIYNGLSQALDSVI